MWREVEEKYLSNISAEFLREEKEKGRSDRREQEIREKEGEWEKAK